MLIAPTFTKETARFFITLIRLEDVDLVFDTMNCKNTAETISFLLWPMTHSQAEKWCQKAVQGQKSQNEFLFLVRDRISTSPVGCICLLKAKEPNTWEIGYWVTENWQGKGCASEMLKAIMEVAFEICGATKLVATAAVGNLASIKVLEKQGFALIGKKELPTAKGKSLICHLFECYK